MSPSVLHMYACMNINMCLKQCINIKYIYTQMHIHTYTHIIAIRNQKIKVPKAVLLVLLKNQNVEVLGSPDRVS